jgi:hypothetical protein
MSGDKIRPIFPSKFDKWLKANGFTTEINFWSSLSGLAQGTVHDHMLKYITSLGYLGTPRDKLRQFVRDQAAYQKDSWFDAVNKMLDGTFNASLTPADARMTEDGQIRISEDGQTRIIQ